MVRNREHKNKLKQLFETTCMLLKTRKFRVCIKLRKT
uniref:Lec-7 protein n=1 Tax=Caenorhabditis elegans TaxID=6239 RepID=Q9GNP3_CAEEL|nr:lec-7 [Caenorhabditis elegans]